MNTWIEGLGTAASIVVAISLTLRNIKRLRIVNLAGSAAFAAYGAMIDAWPVLALNVFVIIVNAYFLVQLTKDERKAFTFELYYIDPAKDEYATRFLTFHADDIRRFFPSFDPDPSSGALAGTEACFILRETLPVSMIAFRRLPGDVIAMVLDYAVPAYRDLKNARFFFETAAASLTPFPTAFTAEAAVPAHAAYLRALGFRESGQRGKVKQFRKES